MLRAVADLATTPEPPYFAVVFTSMRTRHDDVGYAAMARAMDELARSQPGFLGVDSARGDDRLGITVSYWSSLDAIRTWKQNSEHLAAQRLGRERWYASYTLRVAKIERDYAFP
jgi:heme-degrading monooxygenase HmoA